MQDGDARGAKRRKTNTEEICAFLQGLPELVRKENIEKIVQGLGLGSDAKVHTRVLDELCLYFYGEKIACARVVEGGGLSVMVVTIKRCVCFIAIQP
jgi:hypothetical protein